MGNRKDGAGFWSLLLTGMADVWSSAAPSARAHADLLGLILMVVSAASFALMAAFAKLFLPGTPAQVIVFWRGLMMTLVFVGLARARGVPIVGRRPWTLALRGLLGYGAVSCYFASVQALPLGDAVILQYSHPVFVALIAPFLLGERTGRWHWWLLLAAFGGVALIVQPHGPLRGGGSLVGLTGSLLSGLAYMTVRSLSRTENPLTILIWFPALTIPGSLLSTLWRGDPLLPRGWHDVLGHLSVTATALVGQFTLTEGLSRATAARATAVSMAGPVFGLLFGWWLFDTIPEATSVAGTALVCVALTLIAVNRPPAT